MTAEQCRLIRISYSHYFCVKNVKPSHFYDVIEIGNICFMLERKLFSDLQSSEVLMIYCLTRKLKILVLSYSTLNRESSLETRPKV